MHTTGKITCRVFTPNDIPDRPPRGHRDSQWGDQAVGRWTIFWRRSSGPRAVDLL